MPGQSASSRSVARLTREALHRRAQPATGRQRADVEPRCDPVHRRAGDLGQQVAAQAPHRHLPEQRGERVVQVGGADQGLVLVAGRAQQRRLDVHHAQVQQVLADQVVHRHRAMHEAFLREHGQRHHAVAALQMDGHALGVAHARGHHLDHFGGAPVLAEAQQVGLQRRAELRDARADAAGRGVELELVEVALIGARAHQLRLAERNRRLEHFSWHGARIFARYGRLRRPGPGFTCCRASPPGPSRSALPGWWRS